MERKDSLSQVLGNPLPFDGLINIENQDEVPDHDLGGEKCDQAQNPNLHDNRRLFQVKPKDLTWKTENGNGDRIPYESQPRLLDIHKPVPLLYPDHFYEVEGGISLVYFERDRSTACICSIISVHEAKLSFMYRVFGWQHKSRKTWVDNGKDTVAYEKDVWRIVHRPEYERNISPQAIRKGQVIRFEVSNRISDFTGFVLKKDPKAVSIEFTTGPKIGKYQTIQISLIKSATEIMSFPILHKLNSIASGSQTKKHLDLEWKIDKDGGGDGPDITRKPQLLFKCPPQERYKRV